MIAGRVKKIGIISILFAALCGASFYYYYSPEKGPIYDFNPVTDTQPILDIFDQNRYWLLSNPESSPAFMIKHRTPSEDTRYFGALKIKVLREDGRLAGFITYYKQNPQDYQLLFLAVGHEFRGKHYAHMLAQYAIDDMIRMGATRIWLCTRVSNHAAQKIYKNLGFTEFFHDPEGYLYFERYV